MSKESHQHQKAKRIPYFVNGRIVVRNEEYVKKNGPNIWKFASNIFDEATVPPQPSFVTSLIPKRGWGVVAGETTSGTTLWLIDLALAVASGRPYFAQNDFKIDHPSPVYFFEGESPDAFMRHFQASARQCFYKKCNLSNIRRCYETPNFCDEVLRQDLLDLLKEENEPALVIFDHWRIYFPDINGRDDFQLMQLADIMHDMVQKCPACTFILVSKYPKTGGDNEPSIINGAGEYILKADADFVINIETLKQGSDERKWFIAKNKNPISDFSYACKHEFLFKIKNSKVCREEVRPGHFRDHYGAYIEHSEKQELDNE